MGERKWEEKNYRFKILKRKKDLLPIFKRNTKKKFEFLVQIKIWRMLTYTRILNETSSPTKKKKTKHFK